MEISAGEKIALLPSAARNAMRAADIQRQHE
jgi:hypothetical protein